MLDRLPPRHSYESARLIVTLDDPVAVVRAQRPAWVTTDSELHTTVSTESRRRLMAWYGWGPTGPERLSSTSRSSAVR
jgi:hypothetical protein